MDIKKIREDTPCGNIYMNHASTSVPPLPVTEAAQEYYRMIMKYGATSRQAEEMTACICGRAVQNMAEFLHADAEEIMFVPNGTVGIDMAARGLRFKKGQNILLDSMSFVSNAAPWIEAAGLYGLEIRYIPAVLPGYLDLEELEHLIDENTALISVTHAANSLGILQEVEKIGELAQKYGIPYLVDAAGTMGAVSLDVKKIGCDFLTASGRKYLRGPSGTGILYVKKEMTEKLKGYVPAWNSGNWDYQRNEFTFHGDIRKLEFGEKNFPGIFGLSKAVEYIGEIGGMQDVEARIRKLTCYLFEKLKVIKGVRIIGPEDASCRCGTLGFVMEGKTCGEIAAYLNQNGVGMMGHHFFCPGVTELFGIEGTARLSVHYWNTEEEIDLVTELLENMQGESYGET